MTLNELLEKYTNLDEAAEVWAEQEGITIVQARFIVAIAMGESDGDCMIKGEDGVARPAFPLDER